MFKTQLLLSNQAIHSKNSTDYSHSGTNNRNAINSYPSQLKHTCLTLRWLNHQQDHSGAPACAQPAIDHIGPELPGRSLILPPWSRVSESLGAGSGGGGGGGGGHRGHRGHQEMVTCKLYTKYLVF